MTVAELRGRLSYSEYCDWQTYFEEMGPANIAVRFEWAIARAVSPFLKNVRPRDLAIWPKEPEKVATPQDVVALLTNMAHQTKAAKNGSAKSRNAHR